MKVGIIGGGISGLTVAYQLQKMGIAYDLFEQNEEVGGKIKTLKIKNYLLEAGPNSLQLTPELENLIRELKLDGEVIKPQTNSARYILKDGKYKLLPASLWKLLSSNFFSLKTRYKILQERFLPAAKSPANETIASFMERRFCPELLDYVVAPFINGISAGDPAKLLMHKNIPKLLQYETEYGSVLAGLQKNKAFGNLKMVSFKHGLQTLPTAIASKLIALHTGCPVEMITRSQGKYILSTNSPEIADCEYDVVVLAAPAHKTSALLDFTFPGIAAAMQNITYPALAVVHSVYNNTEVGFPLNGFGSLNPKKENQFSSGTIWSSRMYPNRSPEGEILFTTMVGGEQYPENSRLPRAEILINVHEELKRNYQITADRPVFQHISFWNHAIPQYDLFITDAHELAKELESHNFFIASNWYKGISVPDCIKHANKVAKKIQALATAETA